MLRVVEVPLRLVEGGSLPREERTAPKWSVMATYTLDSEPTTLHGHYSPDLRPVLTIQPGDTVQFRTLDAGWSVFDHTDPFTLPPKVPHDRDRDPGHALCGPIAIAGARPGMTLVVRLMEIRPARRGFSVGGGFSSYWNERLGLTAEPEWFVRWSLDPDTNIATSQHGQRLRMRPFIGNLGMPPAEAGRHSTFPPRFCGGNLDCKEFVAGSTLYLPISVAGGLFSLGDGHALQGDGEVSGLAIECPMERVVVAFDLRDDLPLRMPEAKTPLGWITLGLHEQVDEAVWIAIEGMLDLLERRGYHRKEALMLASLTVDLRVTQIVNGVKGAHAILPHDALDNCPPGPLQANVARF
jgi:acetamidase/formamidase